MSIEQLFTGIGIVIDDMVYADNDIADRIVPIVKELEEKSHFPLIKYDHIPSIDTVSHFSNASFLIIDWEINPIKGQLGDFSSDFHPGDFWKKENTKAIIDLIKKVIEYSYMPIFVFSNHDKATIAENLKNNDVNLDKCPVFVESKSVLNPGHIFERITTWVDSVSGVYVAKAWEMALSKAKNQFFMEMANNSSHWPKVLYNTALVDSVSPSVEITHAISQNIFSRMSPIEITEEQIKKDTSTHNKEEVLSIMRGQFFMETKSNESLVGDFYKWKSGEFYMNIRPTCDCVKDRPNNDGKVYLLRCCKLSENKAKTEYYDNGHFKESVDCAIVGPLYKNNYYRINFSAIKVEEVVNCYEKKVGRILPPIINHITERYGLYVQRQALPRIPEEIFQEPIA